MALSGSIFGKAALTGNLKVARLAGSIHGAGSLLAPLAVSQLSGSISAAGSLEGELGLVPIISYGGKTGQDLRVNVYSPSGTARTGSPLTLVEITGKGIYTVSSAYVVAGDLMSVYVNGAPTVFIGAGEFQPYVTTRTTADMASITAQLDAIYTKIAASSIQNVPVFKEPTVTVVVSNNTLGNL
jgi:hypothetical protein